MKKVIRLTESDLTKLVKKIIKESEEMVELTSINNELSSVGLPTLSEQDVEKEKLPMSFFTKQMQMDTQPEQNEEEKEDTKTELIKKVKTSSCSDLKVAKKQILDFLKNKKKRGVQEQAETAIIILGVTVNPLILIGVAVIILGFIIIKLLSRRDGYGCRGRSKSITGYRSRMGFGY
jgi:hypothetical protein